LEPPEPKPTAEYLDALLSMLVGPLELTEEGRRMLHVHIGAERSRKNRQAILALHRSRGPIACEACLKVIATVYGADHAEVVDVHHLRPLAHGVQSPSPSDFAVLCPTCHRVVHFRREEPMPLSELRKVLAAR
jgi:5-methylcytosine-specific restriction protein A